jgi:hypothetical protein
MRTAGRKSREGFAKVAKEEKKDPKDFFATFA